MEANSNGKEKLIQISTPSCYYCVIAKQYITLRLLEGYLYLDLSKLTDIKRSKKYIGKTRAVPQFFVEDANGHIIDSWTGFKKTKIDEFITRYND